MDTAAVADEPRNEMVQRLLPLDVGQRIVTLRSLKNMSQEDLADRMGVARGAVSSWEAEPGSDRHHYPSRASRAKLAYLFEVPASLFLPEE